jgi:hypothetical protein
MPQAQGDEYISDGIDGAEYSGSVQRRKLIYKYWQVQILYLTVYSVVLILRYSPLIEFDFLLRQAADIPTLRQVARAKVRSLAQPLWAFLSF